MKRCFIMILAAVLLIVGIAFAETPGTEVMDGHTAKALLAKYHPETKDAVDCRIYASNDGYAAWILCSNREIDFFKGYTSGTIWYVDDDECIQLGSGDQITGFETITGTQPEICYCRYNAGDDDSRMNAAYYDVENDTCRRLSCGNLQYMEVVEGILCGMTEKVNYDYAFLSIDIINDTFTEILPVEVTTDEIRNSKYAGDFEKVFNELLGHWPDLEIDSWYYYSTGVMTLNFRTDGRDSHIYIFKSPSRPVIEYDSWEESPVTYGGFATKTQKTNLEVSQTRCFTETGEFWS